MHVRTTILLALAPAIAFGARGSPALGASVSYEFTNITNNSAVNADTAGQYGLTVSNTSLVSGLLPDNQVAFLFENDPAGAQSSITGVYVHQDSMFMSLLGINSGPGVNFSPGGSPPSLPGGGPFGFPTGQPGSAFKATANAPGPANGVNPGEWLEVLFTLDGGVGFDDVTNAISAGISNPFADGAMLVGLHVTGFGGGGSESFVAAISLPPGVWIGLAGLGLVAVTGRSLRRL